MPQLLSALRTALAALVAIGCGNAETNSAIQASGGAGAGGASSGDAGLFIVGVLAREPGACQPKADLDARLWARGTLDRLFAGSYTGQLLIGNQLAQRVALGSVLVRLNDAADNPLQEPYSINVSGFVDGSSAKSTSQGIVVAELIPKTIAAALPAGVLIAKLRIRSQSLAGFALESTELSFPIEVCDGCLVTYPPSARDPSAGGQEYQCQVPADGAVDPAQQPCELGIDQPFACTVCSATNAVCASPANNPYYN